jgi:hypothetical protein
MPFHVLPLADATAIAFSTAAGGRQQPCRRKGAGGAGRSIVGFAGVLAGAAGGARQLGALVALANAAMVASPILLL